MVSWNVSEMICLVIVTIVVVVFGFIRWIVLSVEIKPKQTLTIDKRFSKMKNRYR